MMRSAAEQLSADMEHDFSDGGLKYRDFSPTNCEVKSISAALFQHGCLFRNPDYYFMLKKSQKKRVVFRLSGTLRALQKLIKIMLSSVNDIYVICRLGVRKVKNRSQFFYYTDRP